MTRSRRETRGFGVLAVFRALAGILLSALTFSCSGDGESRLAPSFTLHPVSQTITSGNPVTFTVAASGTPAPTFQWERSADGTTWTELGGATAAAYSFTVQLVDNGARFRAIASNGFGSRATSNAATLTVPGNSPLITTHPASQTVDAGDSVTFTVAASGTPAPTFQWERSPDGTNWAALAGAISNSYTLTATLTDNGAQFRAVASNGVGAPVSSNSAVLTVQNPTSVTLTQSTAQSITTGNSVSCNMSGFHAENSYWRVFDLSTFGITTVFDVNEVQFGIEEATGTGGTQTVVVNLYAMTGTFTLANLTSLGTTSIAVPDQGTTVFPVAVAGTVPAGSKLVVEIKTPSGQPDVARFFIGSNNLGQSAPSYISAAACGITEPASTESIGFPDMHIVVNVVGAAR